MFRNWMLAAAGCLAVVCWSLAGYAAEPSSPTHHQQRTITIVTLGDSITKGVRPGVDAADTFAARLEADLHKEHFQARVINVGIGGERTDQALKRLHTVIKLNPDLVTVMYGTNDSYVDQGKTASRISIDAYRANLERIVAELLRRGIQPVLMTEPRWADDARPNGVGEHPNQRLASYVERCRDVAKKWRLPLVDNFATWSAARERGVQLRSWTTDGCHPNSVGHEQITAAMMPVIRAALSAELRTRRRLVEGDAIRVICFGDSVTGVYYHTGSRRAYTDMLGVALRTFAPDAKVEMINAGISGHTTVNALARIDRDVIQRHPDLVTVMFGLNDMTRVSLEDYRKNLAAIVSKCRAAGAEVVLATPNNVISTDSRPANKLVAYCDVVRDVARDMNVALCDVYQQFEAERSCNPREWRLCMSDPIHPNMAGHKKLAAALARTITGQRISLSDVPPPFPAIPHTRSLLRDKKPVRVLAMPPADKWIASAVQQLFPQADLRIESWSVTGLTLEQIEQDAARRVRKSKPDLVLISVPRAARAANDESLIHSYGWIMNWSLNFGSPTWDCVVVHPAVTEPGNPDSEKDALIRRLVQAHDLSLVDRPPGHQTPGETIFKEWFDMQFKNDAAAADAVGWNRKVRQWGS